MIRLSKQNSAALEALLRDESNTIPFITRYRAHIHGGMSGEELRSIRSEIKRREALEAKFVTLWRRIETDRPDIATQNLKDTLSAIPTVAGLEAAVSVYFPAKKRDALTERLDTLGVSATLEKLWLGTCKHSDLASISEEAQKALVEGLCRLIANDPTIRQCLLTEYSHHAQLTCTRVTKRSTDKIVVNGREVKPEAFDGVADRTFSIGSLQPHSVLAIQRGEQAKLLKTSIALPPQAVGSAKREVHRMVERRVFTRTGQSGECSAIVDGAVERAFEKDLSQGVVAELKRKLKDQAHEEAVRVFGLNLRNRLLTEPIAPSCVMGIDPGYAHGCKVCVLSEHGEVLDTVVVYPLQPRKDEEASRRELQRLVQKHRVQVIAIGNGSGCSEAVRVVGQLICEGIRVRFAVVDEAGSSVYSVSKTAQEELPSLEPTLRSAASIGRRLQDPLSEYQHSISNKTLKDSLDDIVLDCVNEVGVNLNTASHHLLAHVAGLSGKLAEAIVGYRRENGLFKTKQELKRVPGLGPKRFEQCAGFLRVPEAKDVLDRTHCHPESFPTAREILAIVKADPAITPSEVPSRLKTDVAPETADWVISEVKRVLDLPGAKSRYVFSPCLIDSLPAAKDLQEGAELSGVVKNVTTFGVFVDVGAHSDGLVHVSQMGQVIQGRPDPSAILELFPLGSVVRVRVLSVDLTRNRIGLAFAPQMLPRAAQQHTETLSRDRGQRSDHTRERSERGSHGSTKAGGRGDGDGDGGRGGGRRSERDGDRERDERERREEGRRREGGDRGREDRQMRKEGDREREDGRRREEGDRGRAERLRREEGDRERHTKRRRSPHSADHNSRSRKRPR